MDREEPPLMGKPTHDGWKPDDPSVLNPPDPPEEHFTDDPLWMLKVKRVVSRRGTRVGTYIFLGVVVLFGLLTWLGG